MMCDAKIKGKRMWMVVLALLLVGAFSAVLLARNPADEAVATVNGEVITERELYQELVRRGGREVLNQMITQRLIHQAARAADITVDEESIQAELERIQQQLPAGMSLEEALRESGMSMDQLLGDIRTNLMLRQLLSARVEITEEEMKEFFEQYKDFLGTEEQVKVRHILVSTQEEAETLRQSLLEGADFAQLAREHSIDSGSAARGGDLGWVSRGQTVQAFEEAAFNSPVGEISPVVKTDFGYHVLLVEDRREAKEANFEDSKDEIRDYLMEEKLQEAYESWLRETREKADIQTYL